MQNRRKERKREKGWEKEGERWKGREGEEEGDKERFHCVCWDICIKICHSMLTRNLTLCLYFFQIIFPTKQGHIKNKVHIK